MGGLTRLQNLSEVNWSARSNSLTLQMYLPQTYSAPKTASALMESLRTTNKFKTGNVFIFGLVAHWARQPRPPRGKARILKLTNNADADINGSSIFLESAIWRRQSVANGDSCPTHYGRRGPDQPVGIPWDSSASSALACRDVATSSTRSHYLPVHVAEALYSRRRDLDSDCVDSRSKLSDEYWVEEAWARLTKLGARLSERVGLLIIMIYLRINYSKLWLHNFNCCSWCGDWLPTLEQRRYKQM